MINSKSKKKKKKIINFDLHFAVEHVRMYMEGDAIDDVTY